jgi:hypothetical protein
MVVSSVTIRRDAIKIRRPIWRICSGGSMRNADIRHKKASEAHRSLKVCRVTNW